MSLTPDELTRYSQQIKLCDIGIPGQIKLKNARVLCVGAGGLASPLLLYLAAAGVGTLGIVDDDIVEISNLQRQVLYSTEDIGYKKVCRAKQQILALNPNANVNEYSFRLDATNAKEIIAQYDIIADCSDNFATRYLINDTCFALNKLFVFASISQFTGQCSTFDTNGPCFRCLFPMIPAANAVPNCHLGGVLGILPGLLGVIQATEILKYILNIGELLTGRLLCIDTIKMQFNEFRLTHNPECELCVHQKTNDSYTAISVKELRHKLQGDDSIFLLDVRSYEEHIAYNIGGKLIPLPELLQRLNELNAMDEIVVYCHLGQRSLYAAELLKNAKFRSVRSLEGGLKAWQNQSY